MQLIFKTIDRKMSTKSIMILFCNLKSNEHVNYIFIYFLMVLCKFIFTEIKKNFKLFTFILCCL